MTTSEKNTKNPKQKKNPKTNTLFSIFGSSRPLPPGVDFPSPSQPVVSPFPAAHKTPTPIVQTLLPHKPEPAAHSPLPLKPNQEPESPCHFSSPSSPLHKQQQESPSQPPPTEEPSGGRQQQHPQTLSHVKKSARRRLAIFSLSF